MYFTISKNIHRDTCLIGSRNLGGALLEASDTSSALLQVAILMLIAYPDAQEQAQKEIDEVVGIERPPTWEDIPRLKYLSAVIEEVSIVV